MGIVPEFISTYNSRKFAFPELVQENDKKKFVLFGGLPKDADKKMIIWEKVAKREPQIKWLYTKNNTLKKENFEVFCHNVVPANDGGLSLGQAVIAGMKAEKSGI